MNEHISKFVKFLKRQGKSSYTCVAYRQDLEQVSRFLDDKDVKEISTTDLKKYIDDLYLKKHFKAKTISRKINSLRAFFNYLIKRKIVSNNPAEILKHPTNIEKLPNILSPTQYKAIRESARSNLRVYTIFELLLQTGLRIGELSRVKLEDAQLNATPPHIYIHANQSNKARIVELDPAAIKVLKKYIPRRGKILNDHGYLFPTRTGNNMIVRNIRTALSRTFKQAGIEDATVNDIRNTFICHQIVNGLSLKKLSNTVGHKQKSSTEKYLELTKRKKYGNSAEIIAL